MTAKRIVAFFLAAAMVPFCHPAFARAETEGADGYVTPAQEAGAEEQSEITYEGIARGQYGDGDYASYLRSHKDASVIEETIAVTAADLTTVNGGASVMDSHLFSEKVVGFAAHGEARFRITVPRTGLYAMQIVYAYDDTALSKNSGVSVSFNGTIPFREAEAITLPRIWSQNAIEHIPGRNDTVPKAYAVSAVWKHTLQDESGSWGKFLFYLEAGETIVGISSAQGGFSVGGFTLGAVDAKAAVISKAEAVFSGETVIAEAENIYRKNDSSITSGVDRSDASVKPNDPVYKKVNVLDGGKWNTVGQSVVWEVPVKTEGTFRIGIRYKQDTLQGMFVSRNVYLDDQLLGEASQTFSYADDWQYTVLSDGEGKEELLVHLEPGVHYLRMEVTPGRLQPCLQRMETAVYVLNYLYRRMVMVCGTSPDPMRDYNIHEEIPYLLPVFYEAAEELEDIYSALEKLEVTGGQASILKQFASQLRSFIRKPYDIQNRLSNYAGNISALSAFIMDMQSQPLSIDHIALIGAEQGDTHTKAGFFENLWFQFRSFIGSFYCDYTLLDSDEGQIEETLKVWFGGGREQAELLKTIIDEDFTANSRIGVQLQLTTITLAQSILAGSSPDVNLTNSRYQAVNLGARGTLEDLTSYPGFDRFRELFGDELLKPYSYEGAVYALPITLDYFVMFCRTDILEELGLSVPNTWDEFYAVLTALQRNNMTVGLPYTMLSTQATIEAGIGAKDIFATLVLQRDASLYSEDGSEILLEQPETLSAFQQWTEFYNQYQLNLEYNFYNRFRTGEMPLGIQSYSIYNLLAAAAPEIRGQWKMAAIPGTADSNGGVNRAVSASGSGVVMLSNSRHKEAAWKFMQWWASAETQGRYGNELEQLMGTASRYNPADAQAVSLLPWDEDELAFLLEQRAQIRELPEVLGGYYVSRGLDNAFRNVLYADANFKEALMEQNTKINAELARKQQELARYRAGSGRK